MSDILELLNSWNEKNIQIGDQIYTKAGERLGWFAKLAHVYCGFGCASVEVGRDLHDASQEIKKAMVEFNKLKSTTPAQKKLAQGIAERFNTILIVEDGAETLAIDLDSIGKAPKAAAKPEAAAKPKPKAAAKPKVKAKPKAAAKPKAKAKPKTTATKKPVAKPKAEAKPKTTASKKAAAKPAAKKKPAAKRVGPKIVRAKSTAQPSTKK